MTIRVKPLSQIVREMNRAAGFPADGPDVPVYEFSNGRQFFERRNYSWAVDVEKRGGDTHLITPNRDHIVTPSGDRIPETTN